jgi:hypothetical protein
LLMSKLFQVNYNEDYRFTVQWGPKEQILRYYTSWLL